MCRLQRRTRARALHARAASPALLAQHLPSIATPGRRSHPVDEALQGGASSPHELAVPLTAHPSGKAQGFVHLRLAFRPLPADQAAAAARAEMAGRLGGSLLQP